MAAPALLVRGRLLPTDEPRDVFIVDRRITFQRPKGDVKTIRSDGWILPGLVDCHVHLGLASPMRGGTALERVQASARAHVDAGVLLVREPGDPVDLSKQLRPADGYPRVVSAGRHIAPKGRYFPGLAREIDPRDLTKIAVETARASGSWVKFIGDFLDERGRLTPNWERANLQAAVRAVHEAGARAAIHATCEESVALAVEAGVDSIEHGTGVSPATLSLMAKKKTVFVPTLVIHPFVENVMSDLSDAARPAFRSSVQQHPQRVKQAVDAGVQVLAGTDAALVPHGVVGSEIAALATAGLSAEQALAAGSWDARAHLGFPGIEEGAPADLVVFESDPRRDVKALKRPATTILDGTPVDPRPLRAMGASPAAHHH